jgi:hypothetical protein
MDKVPPFIDLGVDLASASFPVLLLACEPVSPQCVYVDYRKGAILLVGYLDANSTPLVVNKHVLGEQ